MTCPVTGHGNVLATYDRPAENGRYLVGTKASFTCRSGYILRGITPAYCNLTLKRWEGPEFPRCGKNVKHTIYCFWHYSNQMHSYILTFSFLKMLIKYLMNK